jgi:hypothetical protein
VVTTEAALGRRLRVGAVALGRFRDDGQSVPFRGRADLETHHKDTKLTKKSRKFNF